MSNSDSFPKNPYIGLRSFGRNDNHIFFGRERHTNQLIAKLANEKFIAIVGESGYGKSSLAYAGLLSGLDAGFMHKKHWWTVDMHPKMNLTNSPFTSLAEALLKKTTDNKILEEYQDEFSKYIGSDLSPEGRISNLQETLSLTSYSLGKILRDQSLPPHHNLLILVDQFEEIFRHYEDGDDDQKEDAKKFVKLLLKICVIESVYVVITMRSEYLGKCAIFDRLSESVTKGIFLVPPMTYEELHSAIEKPAQLFGHIIKPDLVKKILNDVKNEEEKTDILPSIQHILMRMWLDFADATTEKNKPSFIFEHYEELGGLQGILSNCANKAFSEELSDTKFLFSKGQISQKQKIAKVLFTCITERKNGLYIRRPTKLSVIAEIAGVKWKDVANIVGIFRNKRRRFLKPHLGEVLTKDSIIDITHEVLIHKWEKLRKWVDKEKGLTYIYNNLYDRTVEWNNAEKNYEKLWSNIEYLKAQELFDQKGSTIEEWVKHNCKNKDDNFELVKKFLSEGGKKREDKKKQRENALVEKQTLEYKNQNQKLTIKKAEAERLRAEAETEKLRAEAETEKLRAEAEAENLKKISYSIIGVIICVFAIGFAMYYHFAQQQTEQAFLKQRESRFKNAEILANNENFITTKQILNNNLNSEPKLSNSAHHAHNLLNWFSNLKGTIPSKTYKGAKSQLHTIAISPDGKTIATAGENGKIVLFDKETAQLLKNLKGHDNDVNAIAFSKQKNWLASSGNDKQIIIWSLPEGKKYQEWKTSAEIWTLLFNDDSTLLASGGNDNKITLWNTNGKLLKTFEGHEKEISSLAFSPDNNLLASSSYDHTVRLWNVETAQELHTFTKYVGKIQSIIFSSNGKLLATGGNDSIVRLWAMDSYQLLHTFQGHKGKIFDLSFIEDDKYLVSASNDKNLRVWDVDSGVTLQVLQGHTAKVTGVTTYENQIFSSSNDGTVKSWELLPNQYHIDLQKEPASTTISPDGKNVAIGFADGTLRLYSLESKELLWEAQGKHARDIQRLAFNSKGDLLVSASLSGIAKIWQWQNNNTVKIIKHESGISAIAFAPNENIIITTSYDGQIGLFNLDADKNYFIKQAHDGEEINSVDFDKTGKKLITASDYKVKLWEINGDSLKSLQIYPESQSKIMWAAISPNGKRYASVGRDNLVKIYSTENGKQEYSLPGHDDSVIKAIFSPDNDQIATVSGDGTLRFWDLTSGNEIFKLRLPVKSNPPAPLWDFDFKCTPTGCWLAVPLTNKKLMLYDMGNIYN